MHIRIQESLAALLFELCLSWRAVTGIEYDNRRFFCRESRDCYRVLTLSVICLWAGSCCTEDAHRDNDSSDDFSFWIFHSVAPLEKCLYIIRRQCAQYAVKEKSNKKESRQALRSLSINLILSGTRNAPLHETAKLQGRVLLAPDCMLYYQSFAWNTALT